MRSAITNYLGMIAIAIVVVLVLGAVAVRIDREQTPELPDGISATPAISGNSPDMLVDSRWLMQYQNHVEYIFDLSDLRLYEEGHIPGAHHVNVKDAMRLHTANYGEADQISIANSRDDVFGHLNLNVPQDARIVLYDANNSERASWMLWVMKLNGFTDVHVLDGGLASWIGEGGEISTDAPAAIESGVETTPTWDEQFEIQREPLLEKLGDPNQVLIDTRSADQQQDTVNGTIREGHIPGSLNIPTSEVMRDDGTFKSRDELRDLFESYGIDPENEIVVYSLFTTDSGNMWLALHLANYDNVVIYQEGFVAWAYDADLPISTDPYPASPNRVSTPDAATPQAATAVPESTPVLSGTPGSTPVATPEDGPTDLTGN